jgi:hypothetical protein
VIDIANNNESAKTVKNVVLVDITDNVKNVDRNVKDILNVDNDVNVETVDNADKERNLKMVRIAYNDSNVVTIRNVDDDMNVGTVQNVDNDFNGEPVEKAEHKPDQSLQRILQTMSKISAQGLML